MGIFTIKIRIHFQLGRQIVIVSLDTSVSATYLNRYVAEDLNILNVPVIGKTVVVQAHQNYHVLLDLPCPLSFAFADNDIMFNKKYPANKV